MQPDTISVRVVEETELEADSADLQAVIEGIAAFSGREAFRKAKELQELVVELGKHEIDESKIKLRSVRTNSQTFAMFKSSSARYWITIASVPIPQLAVILGIVAARKNAELQSINWNFSQLNEVRARLREQALAKAKSQAVRSASVLGVTLLGIHQLTETNESSSKQRRDWEDDDETMFASQGAFGRSKRSEVSTDLPISLANSRKVIVDVQAQFRVGTFNSV